MLIRRYARARIGGKPRTTVRSTAPRPPKGGKVAAVTPCAGDAARGGDDARGIWIS